LLIADKIPKDKWKQGASRDSVSVQAPFNNILQNIVFDIGDDDDVW
jgi:hypothetical protein